MREVLRRERIVNYSQGRRSEGAGSNISGSVSDERLRRECQMPQTRNSRNFGA